MICVSLFVRTFARRNPAFVYLDPPLVLQKWGSRVVPCQKLPSASSAFSSKPRVLPKVCEPPPPAVSTGDQEILQAKMSTTQEKFMMLSKFRLTSLVVITSAGGFAMAPGPFNLSTAVMCCLGTGLLSCAANAINQFLEVPFDAQMARTRNRLLVRNIVTPLETLGFAGGCATTGGLILYFGVNPLTTALGFCNLILYTCAYTPLKRISITNTWVGSIVGALPPLMGWAGSAGSLDPAAWILAGVLFAWQFPHFNALSWNLRPDYSRAGYRMMAVTNPGLCRRTTLRYTAAILALSCAAPVADLTNEWFVLESLPLNSYFLYLAWKFYKESDSSNARNLFRFSLIHLPILMGLMLLNKKKLPKDDDANEEC